MIKTKYFLRLHVVLLSIQSNAVNMLVLKSAENFEKYMFLKTDSDKHGFLTKVPNAFYLQAFVTISNLVCLSMVTSILVGRVLRICCGFLFLGHCNADVLVKDYGDIV